MPNYQNSKIYVLKRTKDDSIFYVGSTTIGLSQRMNLHRSSLTNKKAKNYPVYRFINNKGGRDTFYIELYKKYPCDSIEELHKMEGRVILRLKGKGLKLKNQQVAGRTKKETNKVVRQTKDRIEYMKTYRQEEMICKCGAQIKKCNIKQHEKTDEHLSYIDQINIGRNFLL